MTTENITALPDESLGGVMREYCEVKRKANVGERIKITAPTMMGENRFGEFYTVTQHEVGLANTDGKWDDDSTLNVSHSEYVVLEPTDIIRVSNERLRMVERNAQVGERIKIVDAAGMPEEKYVNGDVGVVVGGNSGAVAAEFNGRPSHVWSREYVVLEPVKTDAQQPEAPSDTALIDLARQVNALATQIEGLTGFVSNIALRLAQMNTDLRVAREDIVLIEEGVTGDIQSIEKRLDALKPQTYVGPDGKQYVKVLEGSVSNDVPSFARTLTRDDIIEKAKRDVAELEKSNHTNIGPHNFEYDKKYGDRVRFVANRDKRSVVALLEIDDGDGKYRVWARGKARCEPADCFNVHIGNAIALRRALGLEVPAEYVTAPQPTDVRVGDIVEFAHLRKYGTQYVVTERSGISKMRIVSDDNPKCIGGSAYGGNLSNAIIIDDSRTEVGA